MWYRKVYKGAKAQYVMQAGAAVNLLLLLVVLPKSIDYIMIREGKKYTGNSASRGKIIFKSE
jgi:hypothetical protein